MALTAQITGDNTADRNDQKTYTCTVTGQPSGATVNYAWSATHGSFVGATDQMTATWQADLTGTAEVDVTITCAVTSDAVASPTVTTGSLAAMTALGITGQILNMYITETEASANGNNKVIFNASSADSALDPGSDDDVSDSINTWRIQYHEGNDWIILNNDGTGSLDTFFRNNTTQSVYLVFSDGMHFEVPNANYDNGGAGWCRWDVTNITGLATKLDDIGADDTLLLGVGDAGSIGFDADSGSGDFAVTVAAVVTDAVLDITVSPTSVETGDDATVTFTFDKMVTGFTAADVTISDGTKGTLNGSGSSYTMDITAPSTGSGTVTVSVDADAVSPGNNADSVTFTYAPPTTDQTVTVQPIDFQMRSVSATLEIQGEDVTEYLIPNQPLQYYESLDYPDFGVFEARGIQLLLDNRSDKFSTGGASNFWTDNSLPSSGAGAEVLLTITETQGTDSRVFRFAGRLEMVRQELKRKVVTLVLRDLSLLLRFGIPSDFGQEITRTITDFDGVVENYMPGQFRFDFPEGYFPIAEGSLSVVRVDGTDRHDVTVVDEMTTSGMLTDDQVFVNYQFGFMIFETEPANGEVTELECTWKLPYHYRRPDALFMELIKGAGVHDVLGITDDAQLRYAMQESGIRVSSPTFSSRGRPYLEVNGLTRWMLHDSSAEKWYLAHEDRLVEYDTALDAYTELAQLPSSGAGFTPPNYGGYLSSESWDLPSGFSNIDGLEIAGNLIYIAGTLAGSTAEWFAFSLLGNREPDDDIGISISDVQALGYHDGLLYFSSSQGREIRTIDIDTNATTRLFTWTASTTSPAVGLTVTDTRIYMLGTSSSSSFVNIYDRSDNTLVGRFSPIRPNNSVIRSLGIAYVDGELFFVDEYEDEVVAISADESDIVSPTMFVNKTLIAGRTFSLDSSQLDSSDNANVEGLDFHNQRLYVVTDSPSPQRMNVYYLGIGQAAEVINYRPLQIATADYEDFFALATITADGDQFDKAVFNPVRIYKYDKSSDVLTNLLNEDTGEPQLAHPYHLNGEDAYRADNRKNFAVIRRSNKTLIFFRYSESNESGIAYQNDTDDTLTKVYTLAHTTGGGIPYSIDFALDERNDGIYVYTFVVWTDDTNDESTLRLYRERVEPAQAESQQYTETIDYAENADTDNEIAVSVSDVILDDTNDKWFFVLTYTTDGDSNGKAELCTIAKDGGGSRTVLKTYDDPLVSARSPAIIGTTIYYLEGGWIRNPRASTEPEGTPIGINAYPDEGGTLISINGATNAITELGLVRRDGTQADSPDDEDDRYAGWGRFNSVLSNIEVDDNDNIHFVTGYGLPIHAEQNSAASSLENPVFLLSNYHWLQWGNDLATKVKALAGSGQAYWNVAQQLSTLVGWELGFGPHADIVSAYQTAYSTASDWLANALPFFRKTGVIESTISANIGTGAITSISLNNSTRFPIPPANASYRVQIGSEVFIYTGRSSTQLTGVSRAQDGSVASVHTSGDEIRFVHGVIRDTDNSLVDITEKYPDIVNLYNVVRLSYDGGVHESEDMTSIDEHGRSALQLSTSLLTMMDTEWQDYLIDLYLDRYTTSRTLLEVQVPLNFDIDLGNVVTVKTDGGVVLDYALYRVLRRTHDFRQYQTSLLLREL